MKHLDLLGYSLFSILMGASMLWLCTNPETPVSIPGTGGVILRMVIAATATCMCYTGGKMLSMYWKEIKHGG